MDFSKRSYQKELLDRDDIPFADIRRNMEELDFINKYLGGHAITIQGFEAIIKKAIQPGVTGKKIFSVCEVGCGGGDNLRVLKKYSEKKKIPAMFSGIDINPHCIEFARSREGNNQISFIASDYKLVKFADKPDIIFCSLFCHHFTDEGVVEIFSWLKQNSRVGFFINDLHRHPLAFYSIKYLTHFFSKSYLVKNDAGLSVQRGFKRKELESFSLQSAISGMMLKWKWAFRWLLTYSHE